MATVADVIEGLKILASYRPEGEQTQIGGAEHDVLYGPEVEPSDVSAEHTKRLRDLGWHVEKETDSWARFC